MSNNMQSSKAQRKEAYANFLTALDAQDVPVSQATAFQAGWDACMRRSTDFDAGRVNAPSGTTSEPRATEPQGSAGESPAPNSEFCPHGIRNGAENCIACEEPNRLRPLVTQLREDADAWAGPEGQNYYVDTVLVEREAADEIERLIRDRDLWRERHDRERAAHAANLTQQQKVEAERDRLSAIESRLDAAICLHLPVDANGPGDCTDRLIAAVELAAQTMRANGLFIKELDEERKRLMRELAAEREHTRKYAAQFDNDRLRAALQWYADNLGASKSRDMRIITQDGGERARKALSGEPSESDAPRTPPAIMSDEDVRRVYGAGAAVAAERNRCIGAIEEYVLTNIDRWATIYGEDRAKAMALDIAAAARSLK